MKKLVLPKLIRAKRARARLLPWLKKTLSLVLIVLAVLAGVPGFQYKESVAQAEISIQESAVNVEVTAAEADERALKLAAYLESRNSQLASYAVTFVEAADKYGLDWKLLPSIAGVESGFARIYVNGSFNAWGWGGGYIYLNSWENAIEVISKALKEKYADKWNARTVEEIGPIWAEDPNWSKKVRLFWNQIENFR